MEYSMWQSLSHDVYRTINCFKFSLTVCLFLLVSEVAFGQSSNTQILLTKNGNNVDIGISSGCPTYAVSRSQNGPQFPSPQTLAAGLPAGSYSYVNGLTNGVVLEFFDVNGTCEITLGGSTNYTGGAIPPVLPQIGSISFTGNLKVGDTLTINGDGFSTICDENVIHFPEGITARSNSGCSPTSITVTIPRGALTGPMRVQVGHQFSTPTSLTVFTDDGYADIVGLDFQSLTKEFALSDRGDGSTVKSRIYELEFAGTVWNAIQHQEGSTFSQRYIGGQGFD